MPKTTLIILGAIILASGVATVFIVAGNDNEKNSEVQTEVTASSVIYVSAETNDTIYVRYAEEGALLNGIGYHDIELRPTEAASGAKYESQKENLFLQTDGSEVTLSRGRKTIFVGTDANGVSDNIPAPTSISEVAPTTKVVDIASTTEPALEISTTTEGDL